MTSFPSDTLHYLNQTIQTLQYTNATQPIYISYLHGPKVHFISINIKIIL